MSLFHKPVELPEDVADCGDGDFMMNSTPAGEMLCQRRRTPRRNTRGLFGKPESAR